MTSTAIAPKATFLNLLRVKLSKIARVERRYIDRAEEHVRAYAEALADVNVITDDERDEFYEQAKQAAEDAVRAYKAAEQESCDHCGAEGPLLPTPEGSHCENCYDQVMGEGAKESRSCDDTDIHAV